MDISIAEPKKFYKRPWFYIVAASALICLALAVVLLLTALRTLEGNRLRAELDALDRELIYAAVLPPSAEPWYDCEVDTGSATVIHDKFPNTAFSCNGSSIYATVDNLREDIFTAAAVRKAYFCDLNFDGYPEICASIGDEKSEIIICDYQDRELLRIYDAENKTDFKLHFAKGRLYILSADRGSEKYGAVGFLHNFRSCDLTIETKALNNNGIVADVPAASPARQVYESESVQEIVSDKSFEGVTFMFTEQSVSAHHKGDPGIILYSDMYIYDGFLFDINGDGYVEICSNSTFGSGFVQMNIIICDYKNECVYKRTQPYNGEVYYKLTIDGERLVLREDRADGKGEVIPLTDSILNDELWFSKIKLGAK